MLPRFIISNITLQVSFLFKVLSSLESTKRAFTISNVGEYDQLLPNASIFELGITVVGCCAL